MKFTGDQYIWMNGWERFQTFQHKRGKLWTPPWIKNYTALLDNPDYLNLSPRQRGLLHGLWLLFGRCPAGGRLLLGCSPARVGRMLSDETVRMRDFASLNHAGWIDLCSRTVLEQRWVLFWNSSGLEVDIERERTKALPVARPDANGLVDNSTLRTMLKDVLPEERHP